MKPKDMALDEPTVRYGYRGLRYLICVLHELNRIYGTSFVSITHDLRAIEALRNRKVWLPAKICKA